MGLRKLRRMLGVLILRCNWKKSDCFLFPMAYWIIELLICGSRRKKDMQVGWQQIVCALCVLMCILCYAILENSAIQRKKVRKKDREVVNTAFKRKESGCFLLWKQMNIEQDKFVSGIIDRKSIVAIYWKDTVVERKRHVVV